MASQAILDAEGLAACLGPGPALTCHLQLVVMHDRSRARSCSVSGGSACVIEPLPVPVVDDSVGVGRPDDLGDRLVQKPVVLTA